LRIYEDMRGLQRRIGVLQALISLALAGLAGLFWHLQVVRGRHFRQLAESNRMRVVSITAPRGALLDRSGRNLVLNRPSFNIVFSPEQSEDPDRAISRLAAVLRVGEAQIRERIARRPSRLRPVVIGTDVSLEDVAAVEARHLELPEAFVEIVPLRSYPLGASAAHSLGRVGEITERQLSLPEFEGIAVGSLVGQAGVEARYNARLMGQDGSRRVVVNSRGNEVAEAERISPQRGPDLTLTLDMDLQQAAERAFAGRSGCAIALDAGSGEILAMTSTPSFDPNEFTTGLDPELWAQLANDPATPFLNRVIQGQYAPGSLFKIVVGVAALEEGIATPSTTFFCPGYLSIYNTVFRCGKASGHGTVSLRRALAESCNVYFFQLGVRLEIERISRWARRLGLGAATGVDLPHEASGLVPSSEWKLRTQKIPWYAGETVSVAIGQGQLTATPLQMARLAAFVANGGRLVQPHLVRAVGGTPLEWPPPTDVGVRPETIEALRAGLFAVVNEGGTGWRARIPGVELCGKTGSAQVVASARLQQAPGSFNLLPHGWFVGFASDERRSIALAVLVEHGGSGGEAAAPVARQILSHVFRGSVDASPRLPEADE
jgi:penicillin-binding protein 2